MLSPQLQSLLLTTTGASAIALTETLQTLWSGYGEIVRVGLDGADIGSVIVKHISFPRDLDHPRGWGTDLSHRRKVRSYDVEVNWYHDWSRRCDGTSRVARYYASEHIGDERVIILEDLDAAGYAQRHGALDMDGIRLCLRWLAAFHARFLGDSPAGLWPVGSYWHLATRPDEYAVMKEGRLKQAAVDIDRMLNQCRYQTLIHGDAKVANFCFRPDMQDVAAVDFQYVGGGCGIKDVAYFMGSCLSEDDCARLEAPILDYYFAELRQALARCGKAVDSDALEEEWRRMYPLAWTDFYRFLLGWAPGHPKIHAYTERLATGVLDELADAASNQPL